MSEEIKHSLEDLLQVTPEQQKAEEELGQEGIMSERHLKITEVERSRMENELVVALMDRTKEIKPEELAQKRQNIARYFMELMQQPSFDSGSYAATRWHNLLEILPRVIDFNKDLALVTDINPRVPFWSSVLEKRAIIENMLVQRIQGALGEEMALSQNQLFDCFTNIKQQQLDTIINQIANSGLSILPESPKEQWARLAQESEERAKNKVL